MTIGPVKLNITEEAPAMQNYRAQLEATPLRK